ncbi:HxlR family transcriptional regulator [Herbihabitans rhizosphaerae]|uniref:HxlR family transcriptional regulator n=2 Tax=Herbihabitans rhizosphaerae TaxID=1872711 RepID=A0A4Q7L6B3_9PSEU|nr:HxlR family transcriptional regulator [Herbihabitans rhizosphaerae]
MDLLGDQWTMLVLRESFHGVTRFGDLQSALGIARNTLTERLDRLTGAGLLTRRRYQTKPARWEYVLTESGRDFYPVLTAIMGWGDRWLQADKPPVSLRHNGCGQHTHAKVVCAACGGDLATDTVIEQPGRAREMFSRPSQPQPRGT